MQPSPYTPGDIARQVPGREVQLAQIAERLEQVARLRRLVARIRVDYAPRGRGKTSMLREAQRRADDAGLLTIWTTATRNGDLIEAITAEIARRTSMWQPSKAFQNLMKGLTFRVSGGVPGIASGEVAWGSSHAMLGVAGASQPKVSPTVTARMFEDMLVGAVDLARRHDRGGVVIFIDEIQDADDHSLAVLTHAWQDLQAEKPDLPVAVLAAGLPEARRVLAAAVSPSERLDYQELGPLGNEAVVMALTGPAEALGVQWDSAALTTAIDFADGYPHSVQLVGDYSWKAAGGPNPGDVITAADVHHGIADAEADLRESFAARLARITRPSDQMFVVAMASLGDANVARADIAELLGRSSASISSMRQSLIDMGVVEPGLGRGELKFTAPGFARFVREQFDLPDPDKSSRVCRLPQIEWEF